MTVKANELNELLEAQKSAQKRTTIITDGLTSQPPKKIATVTADQAERIARLLSGRSRLEIPEPPPVCTICNGSGALISDTPYGHPDFGKAVRCTGDLHAADRLRFLGGLGNLTDEDAKIDLYALAEYHDESELVQLEGMADPRASSNVAMLHHFKEIAENPQAHPLTYVMGPNGNGKSTAAMGLVNALNKAGRGPAIYINLIELIAYIKDAYNFEVKESAEARYRKIAQGKIIVVDEFEMGNGKLGETSHNLELLNRWFSDRYSAAKNLTGVTVVISNSNPSHLGLTSIKSRIRDFRRIANTAPDFRGRSELF